MKITDKQVTKLAEWLGIPTNVLVSGEIGVKGCNNILGLHEWILFETWLYSAEGQEALINKLLSPDMGIRLTFQNRGSLGYLCTIHQVLTWEALGETYQEALIQAVLQLIEAWEK